MAEPSAPITRDHSNAYEIFILVMALLSLVVMALLLLPLDQSTQYLLRAYDNMICFVFLVDVAWNLKGSHPRSEYFIHRRGWLDLLGSIPSFGIYPLILVLRLLRLFRIARIIRGLGRQQRRELVSDVLHHRSSYAVVITVLLAIVVLGAASILVLQFESQISDPNIVSGEDSLWWSIVTITTVGYGDYYPKSGFGQITGVVVMFAGVGIIGALASILSSIIMAPDSKDEGTPSAIVDPIPVQDELVQLRAELAAVTAHLAHLSASHERLIDAIGARDPAGSTPDAAPDGPARTT